jgi:hypothetical protein
MSIPTVTEITAKLEPVTRDDFADEPAAAAHMSRPPLTPQT